RGASPLSVLARDYPRTARAHAVAAGIEDNAEAKSSGRSASLLEPMALRLLALRRVASGALRRSPAA
ncbi:MAG: hypothetical protein OXG18_12790, partial [Gemmatimonadetes bacterium]|nr:hypothetical protein [Gemmatimonadota bacterium]